MLLGHAVVEAQTSDSYTVFYLTSPNEASTYESDFGNTMSDELRKLRARDIPVRRANNETDWNKLPLFEKYQFFTPGKRISPWEQKTLTPEKGHLLTITQVSSTASWSPFSFCLSSTLVSAP